MKSHEFTKISEPRRRTGDFPGCELAQPPRAAARSNHCAHRRWFACRCTRLLMELIRPCSPGRPLRRMLFNALHLSKPFSSHASTISPRRRIGAVGMCRGTTKRGEAGLPPEREGEAEPVQLLAVLPVLPARTARANFSRHTCTRDGRTKNMLREATSRPPRLGPGPQNLLALGTNRSFPISLCACACASKRFQCSLRAWIISSHARTAGPWVCSNCCQVVFQESLDGLVQ